MPIRVKERLTKIFKRKPKMAMKKITTGHHYEFWIHDYKMKSIGDASKFLKETDNQIRKLYKKDNQAIIKMAGWIFAAHPAFAKRYNIQFDAKEQMAWRKEFKKHISQVISFKHEPKGDIFTVRLKTGEIKEIQFKDIPSLYLYFSDPKTIETLKENKIIS